jgi:peptide methionine sulfoxide reductase MsrA
MKNLPKSEDEQKNKALISLGKEQKKYGAPITTEIQDGSKHKFFRAEEYHQKYNEKHGTSCKI